MRFNKNFLISFVFLAVVLSLGIVSSGAIISKPQLSAPGASAFVNQGSAFPDFNSAQCQQGQDFVLQIAPFGCEPSVVRSDLLEDQNVPIFCKIAATKINPLIDVEAINSMSFTGQYSPDVSGVGFYPARAAIRKSQFELSNSPILENIGYAVIVLRQNPNESSMPDFVEGNLIANIKYDIENAFGVGAASYYAPVLEDSEWANNFRQYGFWNGKGFVRVDAVSSEGAVVSIYSNKDNRLATFNLERGETSNQIYLPGFYCSAGLRVRLDSLANPNTRAKLNVNGQIFEVAEGEKFLDNACSIKSVKDFGIGNEVGIQCRTDEGSKRAELRINPKIKLDFVGTKEEGYVLGEKLFFSDNVENSGNVYIGYIGTKDDSTNEEDLYVRFVQMPVEYGADFLTEDMLSEVARYDRNPLDSTGGLLNRGASTIASLVIESGKGLERIFRYLGEGTEISRVLDMGSSDNFYGTKVSLDGLADASNGPFKNKDIQETYENAMRDYETIIDSYSLEKKEPGATETFGESALARSIELSFQLNQRQTSLELCHELEERYPDSNSKLSLCDNLFRTSSSGASEFSIVLNGNTKLISLEGVFEPTLEEYSAEVLVENAGDYSGFSILRKNERVFLSETEFLELKEINGNFVYFDASSVKESSVRETFWKTNRFNVEIGSLKSIGEKGYRISILDANLEKLAKISIVPNIKYSGTEANLSFKIGIEKREIQLSPDKIKQKIEDLNESIDEWEGISDNLNDVVRGFNGMCLATGGYLTVKNYFENLDGKSIARQQVMRSDGGWTDVCNQEIQQTGESLDACFSRYSDDINHDVDVVSGIIQNQEDIINDNLCSNLNSIRNDIGPGTITASDRDDLNFSQNSDLFSAFGADVRDEDNKCSKVSLTQARDLKTQNAILNSDASEQIKKSAEIRRYQILSNINENVKGYSQYVSFAETLNTNLELKGVTVKSYADKDSIQASYGGGSTSQSYGSIPKDKPVEAIIYNNQEYLLSLNFLGGNRYSIDKIYNPGGVEINDNSINTQIKSRFSSFVKYDSSAYENPFAPGSAKVRYFETEPYKGLPALVPFDSNNGWYAATKQNIGGLGGSIRTYDDSGAVSSFYLCNVGENGAAEFNSGNLGTGDDICRGFTPGLGQIRGEFQGLDQSATNQLVERAIDAIDDASRGYRPGVTQVTIRGERFPVGLPSSNTPEFQCQDFMSPEDCLLLFNACDPVVCPSSRCNLGGTYHVDNVVQSGIVGSTLLCLPNVEEDILVPVCLTGIKAGADGFLSVQKNYKNCLEENLRTGQTIGICDEIHSIYLCDFFWSQAAPISEIIIPKIFEVIKGETSVSDLLTGSSTRGGGEYLGVQSAWQNAQDSLGFFSNYYATNSFDAFKLRATEGVGSVLCNNFVSTIYPSKVDILDPDSPPQYTAWFDEKIFTTATVPPTSQYKVFYHIFAGKNFGAYYNVYLKAPQGSSFFQTNPTFQVANGYIERGGFASESKDFTATSGYMELCVRVNEQEECGFQRVTTEFTIDYLEGQYLNEQASQTNIQTESQCISGTSSLYSLANPNLQAGATEAINPELQNHGIVRVCSTDNPGKGTDTNAGNTDGRWVEVGTCDNGQGNLKCYLDQNSVRETIKGVGFTGLEDQTLEEAQSLTIQNLLNEINPIDFAKELERLRNAGSLEIIRQIDEGFLSRVFQNYQKATFLLLRGDAYKSLIEIPEPPEATFQGQPGGAAEGTRGESLFGSEGNLRSDAVNLCFSLLIDRAIAETNLRIEKIEEIKALPLGEGGVFYPQGSFGDSYSENKEFIDFLYEEGLLTTEEHGDLSGSEGIFGGFFNAEGNLFQLLDILENLRNSITVDIPVISSEYVRVLDSAIELAEQREGDYSDTGVAGFIDALYEEGLLIASEYNNLRQIQPSTEPSDMERVREILHNLREDLEMNVDASVYECSREGNLKFPSDWVESEGIVLPPPKQRVNQDLANSEVNGNLKLYSGIVSEAFQTYGVEESIIKAIILQESSANRLAIGTANEVGLMQISEIAFQDVKNNFNNAVIRGVDSATYETELLDPRKNIHFGTAYFALNRDRLETPGVSRNSLNRISILAYNWGIGNVRNACEDNLLENCRNVPEFNLQYVSDVLAFEKGL
ncbi:MAG: transglycosylase SLT domain-containing protein [Candidatus Pacearchaeota archaeon]